MPNKDEYQCQSFFNEDKKKKDNMNCIKFLLTKRLIFGGFFKRRGVEGATPLIKAVTLLL